MEPTNGNSADRLDRIERIIEALATRQGTVEDEFARLLRAQVVIVDSQATIATTVATLATSMNTLTNRVDTLTQRVTEIGDKLDGLIGVVDGFIRQKEK